MGRTERYKRLQSGWIGNVGARQPPGGVEGEESTRVEPAVGGREVDGEGNSSMVGALCLRAFLGDAEPAVAGREVVGGEGVAVRARSPRRSGREGVGGEGVAEA
jgi:hypothetical protein